MQLCLAQLAERASKAVVVVLTQQARPGDRCSWVFCFSIWDDMPLVPWWACWEAACWPRLSPLALPCPPPPTHSHHLPSPCAAREAGDGEHHEGGHTLGEGARVWWGEVVGQGCRAAWGGEQLEGGLPAGEWVG